MGDNEAQFSLKQAVWLFGGLCFIVIGVMLSRRWQSYDPIHISLTKTHGLGTQDFVISIPTFIGTAWFAVKLWQNRQSLRMWIHQEPEKAILVTFVFGILSGILFGAVFGAIFVPMVKSLIRFLHQK